MIILLGQVQFGEYLAALDCQALHAAKAPFEFRVGRAQRSFRVDIEFARQVRGGKQEIADLLEDRADGLAVRTRQIVRRGVAHFRQLFRYFVRALACVLDSMPVVG